MPGAQGPAPHERLSPKFFPPHLPTLVVGDGDLSFSVALNRLCGLNRNLVATVHDTYEALRAKYGPNVDPRIAELQAAAHVQFGVDARCMSRAALAPGPPPEPRPGSAAAAAPGPVAPDQPRVTDGGPPAPAPAERAQAPDGRRLPPSAAARPDAPEPAMDPPPIPRPPQKRPRSTSPGPDPRRDTPTPAAPCGRGAAAAAHDAHAGVGPGGDGARAPSPAPDSAAPTPPAQPSTAAPPAAAPGPDGAAFSRIVFQFPLAPPTSREEYAATPAQAIIIVNRQLLLEFLWECERLLQRPDGAVFITNKDVHPYTQWRIHDRLCCHCEDLVYIGKVRFAAEDFPGYNCRNVRRDSPVKDTEAFTYVYGFPGGVWDRLGRGAEAGGDAGGPWVARAPPPRSFAPGRPVLYCPDCPAGPFGDENDMRKHYASKWHWRNTNLEPVWAAVAAQMVQDRGRRAPGVDSKAPDL